MSQTLPQGKEVEEPAKWPEETSPRGNANGRKKQSAPPADDDDEAILREMCAVNGLQYDKLSPANRNKVRKLEIFFFGCPQIPLGLDQFPNLVMLCIVNQRFGRISHLEAVPLLEELWICETQVQKIEGLSHCRNLLRLHLYTNQIIAIEGLEVLSRLEKLWLNGNTISTASEGLEALSQLRDLNLSANLLTTIGNSFDHMSELETLNLSGNNISSLSEIVHLTTLPKLSSLSLCHPMESRNPVCRLCNYSTHTLYHLPHLNWLDGREVASRDLQRLVQGLVLKKIQYYRMKVHHCRVLGEHKIKQFQEDLNTHLTQCNAKLRTLSKHLKFFNFNEEPANEKLLSKQISVIAEHIDRSQLACSSICSAVTSETEQMSEFWLAELNSGGNVKLTLCNSAHSSFTSCSELIHSRFSVSEIQHLGISGLEVVQVVRVENRLLYNRFNDTLKLVCDKTPYNSMTLNQLHKKRMVDYLFLVWQPDQKSMCQICRDGLDISLPHQWLSNSVNIADHLRIGSAHGEGLARVQSAQLILCKVFLGQASATTSSSVPTKDAFPSADSVFRVHSPNAKSSRAEIYSKDWFIFDTSLILPEYIVYFKYLSPHVPGDPLHLSISTDTLPSDEDIASLAPPLFPRLAMLNESTLLELTGEPSLSAIQQVNICNNRLTRFRLSSNLPNITSLVLSGNELTMAEDFSNLPNLQLLDISFNKLPNLHGLRGIPKLKLLDVSWNSLLSYRDDIGSLWKHCHLLECLDTRHNPWTEEGQLKEHILGRFKTLTTFNGCGVTPEETLEASKKAVSSHLTMSVLSSHVYAETTPPPSLSLEPASHSNFLQPFPITNHGRDWGHKVTTVSLRGMGLCKLDHLHQLPNLCWLSLAENYLTSLEGLLDCTNLEELILDKNKIDNLDGIGNLPNLRWLSLAYNRVTTFPSSSWELNKLNYINITSNAITSLQELKHLKGLMELYLSDNLVPSSRELFSLKSLSSLLVLDMTFNPLALSDTYRSFVIFHLSSLKVLDGSPIEAGDVAEAKEKLGGRLTQDFVFQKYPNLDCKDILKLDLPNCSLKHVDLSPVQSFSNLVSLNVENNHLTSFSGLVNLNHLKVLCLNHNQVEHLFPPGDHTAVATMDTVLLSLQVLHLAYNGISNLGGLHLGKIPSLKALFLQGNNISKVEGIENLDNLTELVLDRNKIKTLQEHSLSGLCALRELHLEENRLRELSYFKPLYSLERLYLGLNRIQDYSELEKLSHLNKLTELSIINNPVSRRLQHRILLVYQHPSLLSLDGVLVNSSEKQAAQVVFGPEQQDNPSDMGLPGLSCPTPLKVLNVPFGPGHHHQNHQQQRRQSSDSRSFYGHVQNLQEKKRGK